MKKTQKNIVPIWPGNITGRALIVAGPSTMSKSGPGDTDASKAIRDILRRSN